MQEELQALLAEKARRQNARPQTDVFDEMGRGVGRAGRSMAVGAASLLDIPRIVTDPLLIAAGNKAQGYGDKDSANTLHSWAKAPTVAERTRNLIDESTDNAYQPKNTLEKGVDFAGELTSSMMAPNVVTKAATGITDVASGLVQKLFGKSDVPQEYVKAVRLMLDSGKTPDEIMQAAQDMKKNPVRTTLFEQVESPKATAVQRSLTEQPSKGGSYMQEFNAERIQSAPVRQALTKGAKTDSPYYAGGQIQQEAGNYINNKVAERSKAAEPLYAEAFNANKDIVSPEVNRILATPAGRRALNSAAEKMQNDMTLMGAPSQELAEQAKLAGTYEPGTGGISQGLKLRTLDYVKRSLDDQIGAAIKGGNNDDARILTGLKSQLVAALDSADKTGTYAKARSTFSEMSPEILALKESKVGKISQLKSPEDAARVVFGDAPENIARMREIFTKQNPQAWKDLTASYLKSQLDESGSITSFLTKIDKNKDVDINLRAALTPEQYRTLQTVKINLRRVQSGLPSNSTTVPKAEAAAILRGQPGMDERLLSEAQKGGSIPSRILDWGISAYKTGKAKINEDANLALAKAITDPDFVELGKALKQVAPNSLQATQLIDNYMSAKIGGAASLIPEENRVQNNRTKMNPANDNRELQLLLQERERRKASGKQSSIAPDIMQAEGVKDKVYKDTEGYKTIGIGFNMDSPNAKKVWQQAGIQTNFDDAINGRVKLTEDEINSLANTSYQIAENDAKSLVKNFDKLSDNRKAAVVQLSYQLGGPRLANFKTTLAAINAGNFKAAARQLQNSKLAKQTPERAQKIARMLAEDKPFEA